MITPKSATLPKAATRPDPALLEKARQAVSDLATAEILRDAVQAPTLGGKPLHAGWFVTPPIIAPPPAKPDRAPEIDTLIQDRRERLQLIRWLNAERELADAESEARKARKPFTDKIKNTLGEHGIAKASWGDYNISYYATSYVSINKDKLVLALLEAGLGTGQIEAVKARCFEEKSSATLRIGKSKKDDSGDEE